MRDITCNRVKLFRILKESLVIFKINTIFLILSGVNKTNLFCRLSISTLIIKKLENSRIILLLLTLISVQLPLFHDSYVVIIAHSCFELMIRKNKRSCTNWKLVITSYNSHVYKTLCLCRSIQSTELYLIYLQIGLQYLVIQESVGKNMAICDAFYATMRTPLV